MHSHICIWYYGAFFSTQPACVKDTDTCNGADNETHRVELAWRVCVTANFLTGLINIFLGFFGQLLMSLFPVGISSIFVFSIVFKYMLVVLCPSRCTFVSLIITTSRNADSVGWDRFYLVSIESNCTKLWYNSYRINSSMVNLYTILWFGRFHLRNG